MLPEIGRDAMFAIRVKGQVMWALRQDILDDGSNSIRRCLHLAGCFMKGGRSRPPMTEKRRILVDLKGEGEMGRNREVTMACDDREARRAARRMRLVADGDLQEGRGGGQRRSESVVRIDNSDWRYALL